MKLNILHITRDAGKLCMYFVFYTYPQIFPYVFIKHLHIIANSTDLIVIQNKIHFNSGINNQTNELR